MIDLWLIDWTCSDVWFRWVRRARTHKQKEMATTRRTLPVISSPRSYVNLHIMLRRVTQKDPTGGVIKASEQGHVTILITYMSMRLWACLQFWQHGLRDLDGGASQALQTNIRSWHENVLAIAAMRGTPVGSERCGASFSCLLDFVVAPYVSLSLSLFFI